MDSHKTSHSLMMILIMFAWILIFAVFLGFFYVNYEKSKLQAWCSLAKLRYSYSEKYKYPIEDSKYGFLVLYCCPFNLISAIILIISLGNN